MKRIGEALGEFRNVRRSTRVGETRIGNEGCPVCAGAGWLRNDVPLGHPLFGREIPCECLLAKREEHDFEELQNYSNLDGFRKKMRFENFDSGVPGVDIAYQAAKRFAQDPNGWLVLHGVAGCGKTHLAAAIAHEAINRRFRALFVVVPDLLDHLRATFAPTSDTSYDDLFERLCTVPLLILDDLGTESATQWAQEKLFQIFNRRYNLELPTVVTTNRRLTSVDDRILSRMTDRALSKVIEIKAGSYRDKREGERRFKDGGAASRGRRSAANS